MYQKEATYKSVVWDYDGQVHVRATIGTWLEIASMKGYVMSEMKLIKEMKKLQD